MATFSQNIDRSFPNIEDNDDPKESVKKLSNYVFQLTKQLKYILANLDFENMTDDTAIEIVKNASDTVKDEVKDLIQADKIISNTVITNELYASYGNIADLTVWKLRTDYERAKRWLNKDTSDLNYIYIVRETISFITAVTDGTESIQLTDDTGKAFYWEDSTYKQMQFKATEFPVMVYKYNEYLKGQIYFSYLETSGTALPVFTLGTGDSNGNGKAKIKKTEEGLFVEYSSRTNNTTYGVVIKDDGLYTKSNNELLKLRPVHVVDALPSTCVEGDIYLVKAGVST